MMRFGLSKTFLDTVKQDVLPEGGMALAGGAVGGLAFGMLQGTKFFQELMVKDESDEKKKATKNMAKKLGLAAIIALGGGSGLWMVPGSYGANAAKGLMGAMGATMTAVLWNHFAKPDAAGVTHTMQLQGTNVYQSASRAELPAGIAGLGNVNVRTSDPRYGGQNLMTVLAGM